MFTEREYEERLKICLEVLKDTYINNIVYLQERCSDKDNPPEENEYKQVEELILANEQMIVYFDQGDSWVKELHEEAERNGTKLDDGTNVLSEEEAPQEVKDVVAEMVEKDEELNRIDKARNS